MEMELMDAETTVSVDNKMTAPEPVKTKKDTHCCVIGCPARSRTHPFLRYHPFPSSKSSYLYVRNNLGHTMQMHRRKLWEMILLMKEPPDVHHRVCSLHFQNGDYYMPDQGTQKKLHNTAVPTLNLPQKPKLFHLCSIKSCSNSSSMSSKRFFTLLPPPDNTDSEMWFEWRRALGVVKTCAAMTVCANHFVSGCPSYNPEDPDFAPSINLDEGLDIEEVNVSDSFVSVAEATLEDPLDLTEAEFVPVEDNMQIKAELLDHVEIFDNCVKMEPVEINEDVKMEPESFYHTLDHSYCK